MMNSMQPSGALARSRLGTATKKMIALLLAAVMFFMLGVVGVMVTKAASTPPTPVSAEKTSNRLKVNFSSSDTNYLNAITAVSVNGTSFSKEGSGSASFVEYYSNHWLTSTSSYTGYTLHLSNSATTYPATIVVKANGYDDLELTINSDGSISTGPAKTMIAIQKEWSDGNSHHENETVSYAVTYNDDNTEVASGQLSTENNWTAIVEIEDERDITVTEVDPPFGYSSEISAIPTTKSISYSSWKNNGNAAPSNGKTYALIYTYDNQKYMLGGNGSSIIINNQVPEIGSSTLVDNAYLWLFTKKGNNYNVQNQANNQYLTLSSNVTLGNNPNTTNALLDCDDGDGSIWTGSYNLLATDRGASGSGNNFTEFNYYELETNIKNLLTYTITNTPTSVTPTESTYTLTYDANEGSGAPDADSKTDTNSTKGFTVSSAKPTREGYDFLGWADSAGATTANYQPGDLISLTGDKIIYAVWKEQEKPIEDPVPEFHKSITPENQAADNYTIQLNITGKDKKVTSTTPGETVTETQPVDIVLVIDQTYSMNTTLSDGKTRLAAVQEAAKQFVSNLDVNEKSKISLISYECYNDDTRKTPVYVRQDWTPVTSSAKASLTSKIDALTLTNYPRAYYTYYAPPLEQTADLLTASSVTNDGNKKYVIFFSDGEASDTYESELAQVKANSTVFAVGVESNDFMASTDKIKSVASDSSKYYEVGNTAEFVEAFNEALQTITSENTSTSSAIHLNNVTISDTLSDYVELSNTNASNNYGITVDNLTKDQYTVTVSGKTVTVKLKDNVTLEDGKTYTVNIPVKPTAKAQTEADAANANTSTFPSNTTASITYKYDGDPTTKNYTETPNILVAKTKTYTVTWKNEDGTVLETDTGLKLGDIPEYNGETPTKEKSNGLVYVFDGWDKEISPVNGDTTYTAKFKEVPQTDYVLHKTSHAMFILSGLCAATAGAMFAVEHYRRKRLTP